MGTSLDEPSSPVNQQQKHIAPSPMVLSPSQVASGDVTGSGCLQSVKFKVCSFALAWQMEGHPKLDFLAELGLQWLAKVDWNVASSSRVEEFISNFNLARDETEVGGQMLRFSPSMISEKLQQPNGGMKVVFQGRGQSKEADSLKFFKDGAYNTDLGFRHDMAKDSSLGRIFTLIAEVVQWKQMVTYTSAYFLRVMEQAKMGVLVDWPQYIYQRIKHKIKELKAKTSKGEKVTFQVGAFIGYLLAEEEHAEELHEVPVMDPVSAGPSGTDSSTYVNTTTVPIPIPAPTADSSPRSPPSTTHVSELSKLPSAEVKVSSLISDLASTLNEIYSHTEVQEACNVKDKVVQLDKHERMEEEIQQLKAEVEALRSSESDLRNANRHLRKRKAALKEANRSLLLRLETAHVEHEEMAFEVEEMKHKTNESERSIQRQVKRLKETMHENDEKNQQQLERLVATITELRTELEVKSFPYGASIWERVQKEAWKQTRAAYSNLVETIADLQKQLCSAKAENILL